MRLGLAAHLVGLMNGIFLIALGAVWTEVRLSFRLKGITFWALLYGTYANWFMTTLAAILGTASLSPVTGVGHSGLPWEETLVTLGFFTVGGTILASSAVVLWGLRAKA